MIRPNISSPFIWYQTAVKGKRELAFPDGYFPAAFRGKKWCNVKFSLA